MTTPVLELRDVVRQYPLSRALPIGPRQYVRAVDGVDLRVHDGQTLGIIGESGCGKSTLARLMTGLEAPTSGSVLFDGVDVQAMDREQRAAMRRQVQMVFQDPLSALNPRRRVGQIVGEPFAIHPDVVPKAQRRTRVRELLELVGLNPDHVDRHPHQFSGGQQQRIGIARAIALSPRLLVCDEAVSALDVSVRAQVVNLLLDLQAELGLSCVFIAHDLQIVGHFCDRVATMYLGQVVEEGPVEAVYDRTAHPYTRALLASAPELRAASEAGGAGRLPDDGPDGLVDGDPPSPVDPPPGCRFNPRCRRAETVCLQEPVLLDLGGEHTARCHFADQVSADAQVGTRG